MTDPTGPRWAADTPEALEWQAIADRHARHLAEHGHPIPQGEAEAEQLRAAHVRELAALSTSGVLFGPDCSQYQGRPAWGTVYASGCRLGFYKGTEGRTFEDSSHQYNRAAVKAAGLVPGVYHFLYYSDEYATNPSLWAAQARWFVSRADPDALHFLDVEAAAAAGHHLGVREWVTEYRRLLPGHALGLYANRSLWANRSRVPYDPAGLFDYVWHAGVADGRYTTATGSIAAEWAATSSLSNSFAGKGYPECRLWQITDHAQVAGVSGTCDGNGFQGTLAELRALITTGTGDDSMSAEDVAALKAYIDSRIGAVPAAVWSYPVGSAWEDDPGQTAGKALRSAQRYAIYGGHDGTLPGTQTPTLGARLAAGVSGAATAEALQSVAASATAQRQAIAAQLDPAKFADAFIGKLGGAGGTLTQAQVREAASEAFAEQLGQVRWGVIDDPA
jgi:GH25 family lysozyme M1 (1,4-beta-N-acetylmuramidase)